MAFGLGEGMHFAYFGPEEGFSDWGHWPVRSVESPDRITVVGRTWPMEGTAHIAMDLRGCDRSSSIYLHAALFLRYDQG